MPSSEPRAPTPRTPRLDAGFFLGQGWPYLLVPFIPVAIVLDLAGASDALVFVASALGIIPTAALMGRATEELVGRVLAPHRHGIRLSTKFGYVLTGGRQEHSEGERPQRWDGPFIRAALEGSLRRLRTDHVDLYQLHNPRMEAIDSDECFATLEELQTEGKIGHYGVALGPAIGWREEGLDAIGTRDIASVQTVYNLLEQDPGRDFLAAAAEEGVGVMARVPTSSGLLDDSLTLETSFGPGDHRRHRPREWLVEGLQKIDRIRFLCSSETERTMAQAALRFILAQPQMTVVIPTITSEAELREYAGAAEVPDLTPEELERVGTLYDENFGITPPKASPAATFSAGQGALPGGRP